MGRKCLTSRRRFLAYTGASTLALNAVSPLTLAAAEKVAPTAPAEPGKPRIFEQAPGFFRFKLGQFMITIVSDGHLSIPTTNFAVNKPEAEVKAFMKANFVDTAERYVHTNICVIDTGEKVVLLDAGSGANYQEGSGKTVSNLLRAGYKVEDVDAIVITHGHPDHIWGIMDDVNAKPRFPNAEYYINGAEWDYWTAEELASKLPKQMAPVALGARRNLLPVAAKTKRVNAGGEVLPGIGLLGAPGHTPGHSAVRVTSNNQSMLVTGDVIVDPYISLERPDWHFAFDTDPEKAVQTRAKMIDMLATDRLLTVAYHFPFPGVGHIAKRGRGYRWLPVSWHWQL